jgi:cell division protein FtsB
MIERLVLWIILFYFIYRLIRAAIQSAVNKGIRDYEAHKESQRHKEKEVTIDRKKVEDAKFKDLE